MGYTCRICNFEIWETVFSGEFEIQETTRQGTSTHMGCFCAKKTATFVRWLFFSFFFLVFVSIQFLFNFYSQQTANSLVTIYPQKPANTGFTGIFWFTAGIPWVPWLPS